MSLGDQLLALAKQHMGLAASAYLTAELRAIGRTRAQLDAEGLREIARRARIEGARFMDAETAALFGREVEALADALGGHAGADSRVDHKLALDAAAKLLSRGDTHRAFVAFKQLAEQHGDVESVRGLARSAAACHEIPAAIDALREGALRLVQRGLRDEAISLLEEAVSLAPTDLAIHRRLVAVYANAGDATSAKCEHARFIEACLDVPDIERARSELDYARQTVGDSPALRELEHRIATGAPKRAAPRPKPVVVVPAAPAPVAATPPAAASAPAAPSAPAAVPAATVAPAPFPTAVAAAPVATPAPAAAAAPTAPAAARPAPRVSATPSGWGLRPDATVEERAVMYIGSRDPRAATDCIVAARELIEDHKDRAAADLLLAYIASGLPGREAQRLLITVDRDLGRADIATEKAQLLARILELEGDPIGARDVKRLAIAS